MWNRRRGASDPNPGQGTTKYRLQDAGLRVVNVTPLSLEIVIPSKGCGFFGDVAITLNGIRFAEANRMACIVDWGESSLFHEAAVGPNAWLYYFEECRFDFSDTGDPRWPISLPYRPPATDFTPYGSMSIRESVGDALRRFCRPRSEILQEVERFADRHFGPGPTLGVHIRMTDAAAGHEDRRTVGLEWWFKEITTWLDQNEDGSVFLATDDETTSQSIHREFGSLVSMTASIRSRNGNSVHGGYDAGTPGDPAAKGREVLVDALLLARCDLLLRSQSRVTQFSLCMNPTLPFIDLGRRYLGHDRLPWLV